MKILPVIAAAVLSVALVEAQRDDPAAEGALERRERGLLHGPAAGDHEQALVLVEPADRDEAGGVAVATAIIEAGGKAQFVATDVSSVRKLGFAGAPMHDALLQRLDQAFRPELFVNHYGSSEVYTFSINQRAVAKPGSAWLR